MAQAGRNLGNKHLAFSLIVLAVIILAGYALITALPSIFPVTAESTGTHLLIICLVIAAALSVPYLLLKAGFHAAHMNNPEEDELKLKDIPKTEKPPRVDA
jgi:hypothetical protein